MTENTKLVLNFDLALKNKFHIKCIEMGTTPANKMRHLICDWIGEPRTEEVRRGRKIARTPEVKSWREEQAAAAPTQQHPNPAIPQTTQTNPPTWDEVNKTTQEALKNINEVRPATSVPYRKSGGNRVIGAYEVVEEPAIEQEIETPIATQTTVAQPLPNPAPKPQPPLAKPISITINSPSEGHSAANPYIQIAEEVEQAEVYKDQPGTTASRVEPVIEEELPL